MSLVVRRPVPLPSFNSVGVSQTASVNCPVGARKYHTLFIRYKAGADNQATLEAAITNVKLLIGGKEQWNLSLADLYARLTAIGYAFQTGLIVIPLSRFEARTVTGEETFGWGTSNVQSFTLELTISGAAVAPTLAGWAEVEDSAEPLGAITKIRTFTGKTASGAGVFQILDLPRKATEAYSRIHIMSALVTDVLVEADEAKFFDLPKQVATALYAKQNLQHIAGGYTVAFDHTEQVTDVLPMVRLVNGQPQLVQTFNVAPTLSGGATFRVLTETVGSAD